VSDVDAHMAMLAEENAVLQRERDEARAEVDRMRPVVEAAILLTGCLGAATLPAYVGLRDAVAAYRRRRGY